MTEVKIKESVATPEIFSTSNKRIALQARLILGDEALNPDKKNLKALSPEVLTSISTATYEKLNQASTSERRQYWKEKDIDNKYLSWKQDVTIFIKSPKTEKFFQLFQYNDAEKIYNRYFEKGKSSNINLFIDDLITTYDGDNFYQKITQDLPLIKKFANIFGGNSAELIEAAIEARIKLKIPEKKQEFINQINEEKNIDNSPTLRLNWLNKDEERLLKWLNKETPLTMEPKPINILSPELARDNPNLFTHNLLENIKNTNPRLYNIWEFARQKGLVSIENLHINPNTWMSESDSTDGINLGTLPMSKDAKYRILFDDEKFDYQSEVIYRLSHELSHKLNYFVSEKMNQKSEFNYLLTTLIDLNKQKGKVISALASQEYYRQKGPTVQGQEDLTELTNMYIQDPNYLKRYLKFLADDKYTDMREKYGLVDIDQDVAQTLYDQVEQGLKPFFKIMTTSASEPVKVISKTQDVDFTISYEQNRKAADQFISVLRNPKYLKPNPDWPIYLVHDYGFVFHRDNGGTFDNPELLATRYHLPFAKYSKNLIPNVSHAHLVIRGPYLDELSNQWKITIYNPYHLDIKEEILENVHNKEEALARISYNKLWKKEYLRNEEDISFVNDPELKPYLDVIVNAKLAPFQRDMINCYPYCFFVGAMLNALKPGQTDFKTKGIPQFFQDFGLQILDRDEISKRLKTS